MTRKHLVFLHQNYPAQFGPVCEFLLKSYDVNVTFLCQNISPFHAGRPPLAGVNQIFYEPAKTGHEETPYFFGRFFEQESARMHGIWETIQKARIQPDVFIGHAAFGTLGLLHVAYPDIPRIGFFELFYTIDRLRADSRPEYPVPLPNRLRVPLRNATQLVELEYATRGYSPTAFQRSTFPVAYQDKLSVCFDGIDVQTFSPGPVGDASELVRTWPAGARLVTFVSRGLEAMRGFDVFMAVAERVSRRLPDVHFVIAGKPKTHYGSETLTIKDKTFKDHVLSQVNVDLSRFHFLDWISGPALVDLYRLSACHFYWTTPFTLSWSLLQAMATGCVVLGSDTEPLRDAITDGETGYLRSPYDVEALTEAMVAILDNPAAQRPIRDNARQRMVDEFSFEVCLPKLAEFYMADGPLPQRASQAARTPAVA